MAIKILTKRNTPTETFSGEGINTWYGSIELKVTYFHISFLVHVFCHLYLLFFSILLCMNMKFPRMQLWDDSYSLYGKFYRVSSIRKWKKNPYKENLKKGLVIHKQKKFVISARRIKYCLCVQSACIKLQHASDCSVDSRSF